MVWFHAGERVVIASHNAGKVSEIAALLAPYEVEVVSAASLGQVAPEETGADFISNALLKARASAKAAGLPALADDSGLAIDALAGAPGIYSARWAEMPDGTRDWNHAMAAVHEALLAVQDSERGTSEHGTGARFICALAVVLPDGAELSVEGEVVGDIVFPPRGRMGFGYDPIFQPRGQTRSFGEMGVDEKAALSHRTHAFRQLIEQLF